MLLIERAMRNCRDRPEASAAEDPRERLSYRELGERASQLAADLRGLGVGPGSVVGLQVPSSAGAVAAMVGIASRGAAYVPISAECPEERRATILREAGAEVVVIGGSSGAAEPRCLRTPERDVAASESPPGDAVGVSIHPDATAYVIFTSGSTGAPKGVEVPHRCLTFLDRWAADEFELAPGDRVAQIVSLTFDISVLEIWPTLAAGGTVCVPPATVRMTPHLLAGWLVQERIAVCFVSTQIGEQLLQMSWPADASLRTLATGGEQLRSYPPSGLPFRLLNGYGPTETTVAATAGYPVSSDGPDELPHIGTAVPGAAAHVLDDRLEPVAPGEVGELHIGGSGVSRGYIGRPGLTAERFLPDPWGGRGDRMYRSGDMVRQRRDGSLAFVGRADAQVKIRGVRLELGEVEAAFATQPGVALAAARAWRHRTSAQQLAVYVQPNPGQTVSERELMDGAARRLPEQVAPQSLHVLERVPLSENGKIDRRRLPQPDWAVASEHEGATG